jgi:LuxR family transcriptional regulator, maltose regulon positive regulatory protein
MKSPLAGGAAVKPHPSASAGRPDLPLLMAKLAPPDLAHPTVLRPRLLSQLSRGVQRAPVTLITGLPGSGKTVLAASWRQARGDGKPVAWLSLDAYDDDPATFWAYAVGALAAADVALADLPVPVPGEQLPSWFIPRLARQLAARSRSAVLILNDVDLVTDPAILSGLDLLVRNAGSRLRLVLCARTDPLLPLHQYRLAGSLFEIRGDQLAFTADETRELLAAMGIPVAPTVAAALCAEAEGWAVGVRLAAVPLRQGTSPTQLVTSLAQDDGSVAQYLVAEVLNNQPASVRRFLLRISVTSELWPDLVDRLSGRPNGRRTLSSLAHANAFVEQSPNAPGGFRIHSLFQQMLQAELTYEHPAEVPALHRICAAWYAQAGRTPEAIRHAVAARDWGFVTRLVHDELLAVRLLAHGNDAALRGLGALPADLPGPEAAVIRAAAAAAAGRPPAVPDLLTARAVAADARNRPTVRASAALTCVAADAALADSSSAWAVDPQVARSLLAGLPEERNREQREGLAVVEINGALRALRGDAPMDDVTTGLRTAAMTAHSIGSPRLRCRTVATLALLEAVGGRLARAAQLAEEAESLQAAEGRYGQGIASATAQAWIHLERYALVEAREWLGIARARERERPTTPEALISSALLAVLQSRLLRLRHEYDAAENCLRQQLSRPRLPRWVRERLLLEAVRVAFARGQLEQGVTLLDEDGAGTPWYARLRITADLLGSDGAPPRPLVDEPSTAPIDVVETAIVRAGQLFAAGSVPEAVTELTRALATAQPEALRWPFLDAPPQARRLLRSYPPLQVPAGWLRPSSAVPGARPAGQEAPDGAPVTQDLSEREREVLTHLSEMLSTAEIAATMFISVNTVRTHIRSILRKLGVSRRNQAVRRARQLGVL